MRKYLIMAVLLLQFVSSSYSQLTTYDVARFCRHLNDVRSYNDGFRVFSFQIMRDAYPNKSSLQIESSFERMEFDQNIFDKFIYSLGKALYYKGRVGDEFFLLSSGSATLALKIRDYFTLKFKKKFDAELLAAEQQRKKEEKEEEVLRQTAEAEADKMAELQEKEKREKEKEEGEKLEKERIIFELRVDSTLKQIQKKVFSIEEFQNYNNDEPKFIESLGTSIISEIQLHYKFPDIKSIKKKGWADHQLLNLKVDQSFSGVQTVQKNWDSVRTSILKSFEDSSAINAENIQVATPFFFRKDESTFNRLTPVLFSYKAQIPITLKMGTAIVYRDGTLATKVKVEDDSIPALSELARQRFFDAYFGQYYDQLDYETNKGKKFVYKYISVFNTRFFSLEDPNPGKIDYFDSSPKYKIF